MIPDRDIKLSVLQRATAGQWQLFLRYLLNVYGKRSSSELAGYGEEFLQRVMPSESGVGTVDNLAGFREAVEGVIKQARSGMANEIEVRMYVQYAGQALDRFVGYLDGNSDCTNEFRIIAEEGNDAERLETFKRADEFALSFLWMYLFNKYKGQILAGNVSTDSLVKRWKEASEAGNWDDFRQVVALTIKELSGSVYCNPVDLEYTLSLFADYLQKDPKYTQTFEEFVTSKQTQEKQESLFKERDSSSCSIQ